MADADEIRRTARATSGPNAQHLGKAQTKYKTFDRAANTEYERLLAIDGKKKLTPTQHPVEHATFVHLCNIREGVDFDSNMNITIKSDVFNPVNIQERRDEMIDELLNNKTSENKTI